MGVGLYQNSVNVLCTCAHRVVCILTVSSPEELQGIMELHQEDTGYYHPQNGLYVL